LMADQNLENMTGRVYRVAPKGSKPSVPKLNLDTAAGCVEALASPNLSARYLAWAKLHAWQGEAEQALLRLWKSDDPRLRARALRHNSSPEAPSLWAQLAAQHDGKDRWYLEALGIGADRQWEEFFDAWLAEVGDKWNTPAGRDIVWRSRSKKTPALLVKIL